MNANGFPPLPKTGVQYSEEEGVGRKEEGGAVEREESGAMGRRASEEGGIEREMKLGYTRIRVSRVRCGG